MPQRTKLMKKPISGLTLCSIIMLFLLCTFSSSWSGTADIDLKFQGETLSANLTEAPLKDIAEKLEKEIGVSFKGDASLFNEKVSVRFKNLPLENGLKRILCRINYSLVFDGDGRVASVIVLGRAAPGDNTVKRNDSIADRKPVSDASEGSSVEESFEVVRNAPPPENPHPEPIDMKIVRNSPPPENPHAPPIDTTVMRDSPPPGNPHAKLIDTTILRDVAPPGQ